MSSKKQLLNRLEVLFDGANRLEKDGGPSGADGDRLQQARGSVSSTSVAQVGPLVAWRWETDAAGIYTSCSDEVQAVLGFTPDEMLGRSLAHVAISPVSAAVLHKLTDLFGRQRPVADLRLGARRKDGQVITLIFNGLPLLNDEGRLVGYRGICQPESGPVPIIREHAPPGEVSGSAAVGRVGQPDDVRTVLPSVTAPRGPLSYRGHGRTAREPRPAALGLAQISGPGIGYLASSTGLKPIGEMTTAEMNQALASGELVSREAVTEPGEASSAGKALALPIQLQKHTIGVLNFFDEGEGSTPAWTEDDLALAQAVAVQLALALENAGLLEQITQERERLALLYDVLTSLASSRGRAAILYTALHLATRLGAQHAYVLLLGQAPNDSTFRSTLPGLDRMDARQARDFALKRSQLGLENWVLAHGRPAVIQDTRLDDRWYTDPSHSEEELARSVISVPLQAPGGDVTGALAYTHPVPGTLTEEQLPIVESIASQVAVALENDRLTERQRLRQYSSNALARTAQAMTRTLDETELYEILAEQLFESFRPQGVAVYHWEPAHNTLTPVAMRVSSDETESDRRGWPAPGRSFPANAMPDLLQVLHDRRGRISLLREEPDGQIRESAALPLLYGGLVEGAVELIHVGPIGGLSQMDMDLFEATLTTAASALQSARLYALQRQTAERLAEVDRLKSQFLANMSHELRTPLNSIIGFSRVILKGIDGPLTDVQTQDLTSINSAGQHLLRLINDVLDMAKIEAGKMELVFDDVDLREMIAGVLATTRALVKDKPVTLEEVISPDLPMVRADSMRLRQVLLNLLSNAAKFTDQGRITVRARPVEAAGARVDEGQVEACVEISVADTGHGIAPEHMPKLFEAFSQVDASPTRAAGGTGLGLSICRQLVELHGGRIWAESQVGRGSTFAFVVPLRQPQLSRDTGLAESPAAEETEASAPVILAVDDDAGVITLYRRYLEPRGYTVVGVNRSREAASRAAELKPVAILLDVLMSNQDGWQVLAELKHTAVTRDIPVMMCTLVVDQERARRMGAAAYLIKPILESELVRALNRIGLTAPAAQRERYAASPVLAAEDWTAPA